MRLIRIIDANRNRIAVNPEEVSTVFETRIRDCLGCVVLMQNGQRIELMYSVEGALRELGLDA